MPCLLIFTDLDGTLLDHHSYSFAAASEAIATLNHLDIPWILNSSKTMAELRELKLQLGQSHPVIVENGAGVAIPVAYKHPLWHSPDETMPVLDGMCFKRMGKPRDEVLEILEGFKKHFCFTGFADMDVAELCRHTGLSAEDAVLAKARNFSEPVLWQDSAEKRLQFRQLVEASGLQTLQGGRFLHVGGVADKGKAMQWLMAQYRSDRDTIVSMALGDSQNDVAMLTIADVAVVIRSPVHEPPQFEHDGELMLTDAFGPEGWNKAVLAQIEK